jgi:protein disulfide-isomerase A1
MLHFLERYKRPVVTEVTSESAFAEVRVADETVFIALLSPDATAERKAFEDVAARYRYEFTFAIVSDPALIEAQGLSSPAVVCYRLLDRDSKALPSVPTDAKELEQLVLEASRPVIGELTPWNHQRLLDVRAPHPAFCHERCG